MISMKSKLKYVGIRVKDLQKSLDFYTKLLGMKVVGQGRIEATKGTWISLKGEKGGFNLELNYYESDGPYSSKYVVGEGLDHLAFEVDNLDKALEESGSLGYKPILEMKQDGGRWAYIEDPNGIWIEFI